MDFPCGQAELIFLSILGWKEQKQAQEHSF